VSSSSVCTLKQAVRSGQQYAQGARGYCAMYKVITGWPGSVQGRSVGEVAADDAVVVDGEVGVPGREGKDKGNEGRYWK
jgi:hypothetical protein